MAEMDENSDSGLMLILIESLQSVLERTFTEQQTNEYCQSMTVIKYKGGNIMGKLSNGLWLPSAPN
jgi:hypothetical protein